MASLPSGFTLDRLIDRTADHRAGPRSTAPCVDGSTIGVRLSAANARVLGASFGSSSSPGWATACVALVRVSSRYAYDYDPTDGIGAGLCDFVGIATHVIGHASGSFSGGDRSASCLRQKALLMTPPSTRRAAPVVADASGLATYATSEATSCGVAKRLISEVGRT